MIFEHYNEFNPEWKRLLPLRRVYVVDQEPASGLRHTAITAALDAGVSLRDVQDFARHADPRTTRRYDRGRDNLDRNAAHALAAYFAEP